MLEVSTRMIGLNWEVEMTSDIGKTLSVSGAPLTLADAIEIIAAWDVTVSAISKKMIL